MTLENAYYDTFFFKIFISSTTFNRRSSSNSLKSKNGREPTTSKDDITYCSICQYALIDSDVIKLYPCKHNFHKDCMNELRRYDPGVKCSNTGIML